VYVAVVTAATLLLKQDAQVHDWASKGTSLGGQARLSSWLFSLLRCKMSLILPKCLYGVTTSKNMTESLSEHVESQPLQLGIAPRPTIMQDLYCDNAPLSGEKLTQEQIQGEVPNMDEELPIAIQRTKQDPKPSNWLKEFLEYLSQLVSNTANTNLDI